MFSDGKGVVHMENRSTQEFLELISNLNQNELSSLLDYAIKLKEEELEDVI